MQAPVPLPTETLAACDGDELRARIFYEKYALRDAEGRVVETTPDQMWQRVAGEIALVEPDAQRRAQWAWEFAWLLSAFRFIPGGRILHGAGNPCKVTLLSCYVEQIPSDSIEGIYTAAMHAAKTYSRGGGIGIDLSPLRPAGAPVDNAARHSTGAVSFMELFSLTTGLIGQSGRRGALMLTLADHHPDVLAFCRIKRTLSAVRYANISVRCSDAFMRAVEADGSWTLVFESERTGRIARTIRARELWDELIGGARDWAEPGCLFWDTITRYGTSEYGGMGVVSTNPCSEHPLEPGGCCDLGSLNLSAFVVDPFTPRARIEYETLDRAVVAAVRFLDNVLTYNEGRHALSHQEEAARRGRRVGVGITGLADLLAMLGLRYDTEEAMALAEALMRRIKEDAYWTSVSLAREKGPFPAFDAARHLAQAFFARVPAPLREAIRRYGLRNVSVLTIPPVGSGAALAGVSSGLEPIFALTYVRRSESLSQETFRVLHPLVASYFAARGEVLSPQRIAALADPDAYLRERLPRSFAVAHDIDPAQRVEMQAALQRHIDQAISSTINLPGEVSAKRVGEIYFHAWRAGLKGISVYRQGSREGVLLTAAEAKQQAAATPVGRRVIAPAWGVRLDPVAPDGAGPAAEQIATRIRAPAAAAHSQSDPLAVVGDGDGLLRPRPERLDGPTYRIPTAFGTAFVTITERDGQPFEIFGRLGKAGSDAEADAEGLGRLCSILLRLRGPGPGVERVALIVDQLARIGGARPHGFGENRVRSIPDAFALALRKYLRDRHGPQAGAMDAQAVAAEAAEAPPPAATPAPVAGGSTGDLCPRCGRRALVTDRGCTRCDECGFREC
jgi:ribonucleoside-diphosphate reductase alpha chain